MPIRLSNVFVFDFVPDKMRHDAGRLAGGVKQIVQILIVWLGS